MKVVKKIKTHILCSVTFSRKSCRLCSQRDCRWQYGGALHAGFRKAARAQAHASAHEHPPPPQYTQRARTHTHRNMQGLLLFHYNHRCMNTPQCYVTRTLPLLLCICYFFIHQSSSNKATYNLGSSSLRIYLYSFLISLKSPYSSQLFILRHFSLMLMCSWFKGSIGTNSCICNSDINFVRINTRTKCS
jgi:hypothetical protein